MIFDFESRYFKNNISVICVKINEINNEIDALHIQNIQNISDVQNMTSKMNCFSRFNKIYRYAMIPICETDDEWNKIKNIILNFIDFDELLRLPFLVLNECMKNNEIEKIYAKYILKICQQILLNFVDTNKFVTNIKQKLNNFINKKKVNIENDNLFIMYIKVLQSLDYINQFDQEDLLNFMRVMTIRKIISLKENMNKNVNINGNSIIKILNEKKSVWIDKNIKEYEKQKMIKYNNNRFNFKKKMISKIKNRGYFNNKKIYCDKYLNPNKWNPDIKFLNSYARSIWNEIIKIYDDKVIPELCVIKKLCKKDYIFITNLENLGLETINCKLAFILQFCFCENYHIKNKNNKNIKYLNNINYVNYSPYDKNESKKYLKKIFTYFVIEQLNIFVDIVDAKFALKYIDERVEIFEKTNDIIEAAGVMKGIAIGKDLKLFINKLQNKKCPLAFEKIKLLINGKFRGVNLYSDCRINEFVENNNYGWKPSRKNCFKFWLNNKEHKNLSEWKKIFDYKKCNVNIKLWNKIYK